MTKNEYFNSQEFEDRYHYDGKLGSFCDPWGTTFTLWAPTAEAVVLRFFPMGSGPEEEAPVAMIPGERGVWHWETDRNLDGTYYCYDVTVEGETRTTADPYARACGVNGHRSMVVDLTRTDPEGWNRDLSPVRTMENIIYEIHVKEFSWDESSGIAPEHRGRYTGLCQTGTTLNGDGIHATGIDYLKELGVTHVQLLPVFDYGSVDENHPDRRFNWGYDPVNYNVPEGSYSSDPHHGEVRIRELKQAIQSLHRAGFRVIMDVVYNHTYHLDSFLNRTVPGYYYRFDENGDPANGSGCGNDTASERSMCSQYILDSVLYWAEEYHFDGFRFDLMGLMPVDLMNRIRKALDDRFGVGEKLVFGEPWRAADTAARPGTLLADKTNLRKLNPGVGAFCDATRDAVKGNLMQEKARGFVNGGKFYRDRFIGCLKGWAGIRGEYSVNTPMQTISYLSCHDDWTLWDRLINTLDETNDYNGFHPEALRANRLAAAILMGCQGNLFLLSGEEFGRTKQGIKNSFESPIHVNRLDWNRAWANEELKRYYQGLFALRKQIPSLCDKSRDAARWIQNVVEPAESCAVVDLACPGEDSRWHNVVLLYNMGRTAEEIRLPEGAWQVLAAGTDTFLWEKDVTVADHVLLEPVSAVILGR